MDSDQQYSIGLSNRMWRHMCDDMPACVQRLGCSYNAVAVQVVMVVSESTPACRVCKCVGINVTCCLWHPQRQLVLLIVLIPTQNYSTTHSAASQTRSNTMLLVRWSSTLSLSDILTTNVQIIIWR